jgi:hypothetical protein
VCDVGIGCGAFLEAMVAIGWEPYGIDVNPVAVSWLRERGWLHDLQDRAANRLIDVWSFWDVLEHIPDPSVYWRAANCPGVRVAMSLPIFDNLAKIRESKHYRPDEHYLYFTDDGIKWYMAEHGFKLLTQNRAEVDAGREEIGSYLFVRE